MSEKSIAALAAQWACSKIGYKYSQSYRTHDDYFDCSSLAARSYMAHGKRWRHGGSIPLSMHEVYDDEFELLWPETYELIGKKRGGKNEIALAKNAGDLQFLCTNSKTGRANKITHVAIVADEDNIVHARGKAYGVRKDPIMLYSGKLCAVTRYSPHGDLRIGMKGFRTLELQKALNESGADLEEDGDFGERTANAVSAYQEDNDMQPTGIADRDVLISLGLLDENEPADPGIPASSSKAYIVGNTVNIRTGPGTNYDVVHVTHKGDEFDVVDTTGWHPVNVDGVVRWVSAKYTYIQKNMMEE